MSSQTTSDRRAGDRVPSGWAVRVVAYDAAWPMAYEAMAAAIRPLLGGNLVEIHHIGSTSVPGLDAKPIIDMLASVRDLTLLDGGNPLASLGFEAMGEFGIPGRRYFRRDDRAGNRTHHLHVFAEGHPGLIRHLAFRDFLRAHASVAREYAELKHRLAQAHPDDREAYQDGKAPFIQRIEDNAITWFVNRPQKTKTV